MTPAEVLVTFYCRTGGAESLALAAAVGAVQARAMIRLRRLPDVDSAESGEILRMRRDYVAPTEADVLRADAVIVAAPADFPAAAGVWEDYLHLLATLSKGGQLDGKVAAALAETPECRRELAVLLSDLGFILSPCSGPDSTAIARAAGALAHTLKNARSGQ